MNLAKFLTRFGKILKISCMTFERIGTCNDIHNSTILRCYVRFLQDKVRYWFQIHASSYCDGHARSHVKIIVRSWKFL